MAIGEVAKGVLMIFISVLWSLSIFVAVFCLYWSVKSVGNATGVNALLKERFARPRLHFVDGEELQRTYKREPHHVYFHLQSEAAADGNGRESQVGITVKELEECIRWIPLDTKIYIACPDGFRPPLLRRIRRLRTKRELFLVRGVSLNLSLTKAAR
jgi:hypothetical protein